MVAEEGVNCNKAKEMGDRILRSMVRNNVHEYSFQKKQQVLTLASKTAVQFKNGKVQVDQQLLFQRLSMIATSGRYDNPEALFKYKMSSSPTALFNASLLPRQANKPALADSMQFGPRWKAAKQKVLQLHIKLWMGVL